MQKKSVNLLLTIGAGFYFKQFSPEQFKAWLTLMMNTMATNPPADPQRLSHQHDQLIAQLIAQISTGDNPMTDEQAKKLKMLLT